MAGGADVLDVQMFARYAGQRKTCAQYLPPALSHAAINQYGFHVTYPKTTVLVIAVVLPQPGAPVNSSFTHFDAIVVGPCGEHTTAATNNTQQGKTLIDLALALLTVP